MVRRSVRCASVITPRSTATEDTPGTADTAAVTSVVSFSRIGQPETVSSTRTVAEPSGATLTRSTMPSSVIGRWISGSWTPASAAVIAACRVLGSWATSS